METNYYHVNDPLENFELKVVVRESSRAITGEDLLQNEAVYYEEVNISWQEKLYGPGDIVKNFLKNGPASEQQVVSLILLGSVMLLFELSRRLACLTAKIWFSLIYRTQ